MKAFPTTQYVNGISPTGHAEGMELRDYFAAKALPCALKTLMHDYTRDDSDWTWSSSIDNDMLAELAYEMADAMLEARK